VELAADVNSQMANYVVWRIQDMLNRRGRALSGTTLLCLGAAFKSGVSDVRNSRAIHVMELLAKQGATIVYCDPHVPSVTINGTTLQSIDVEHVASATFDAAVVLVGGSSWPLAAIESSGRPVFDAVNAGGEPSDLRERL
jgi:UDP-N-acetyl-D-glucosamine dehydrogenase